MSYLFPVMISGYKYPTGGIMGYLGTYYVQLNPSQISITVGQQENKDEDSTVHGSAITSKASVFIQRTLSLNFTLDNTGAVPQEPDGMFPIIGTLADSIKALEELTVEPVYSTHRPPFVRVSWGLGDVSLFGICSEFSYDYTFFDQMGIPLRANVSMKVQDFDSEGTPFFLSPDITKMPTVKQGDSIVKLSEEYYDDKKYYIKLAEFNNLSSLRNLKKGSQVVVPPLK